MVAETFIRGHLEAAGSSFEVPYGIEKQLEGSKISCLIGSKK